VDARLLDMLHDAADDHSPFGVGHRVHVEFERVFEKSIDQNWPVV